MLQQKYFGFVGFGFYVMAIFLFVSFITTVIFGAFAIGATEKMTVENYFILLGEYFVAGWYLHFPAMALIIGGYVLNKKRSKGFKSNHD